MTNGYPNCKPLKNKKNLKLFMVFGDIFLLLGQLIYQKFIKSKKKSEHFCNLCTAKINIAMRKRQY